MPEDAMLEREVRLHGNDDSLDDVDELTANGNGKEAPQDIETGYSKVASAHLPFTWRHMEKGAHQRRYD